MDLQKNIIDQYLKINQKPTLKFISQDTGIQLTRVFRILNGAKMHLEEFEIFYQRVQSVKSQSKSLDGLIFQCQMKLSEEALKELEESLAKKLWIWDLHNSNDKKIS